MELIFIVIIVALVVWYFYLKSTKNSVTESSEAPYKVETPTTVVQAEPTVTTSVSAPVVVNDQITDAVTVTQPAKPKRGRKPAASKLDVNKDGKVDLKDAAAAVKKVTKKVKSKKS